MLIRIAFNLSWSVGAMGRVQIFILHFVFSMLWPFALSARLAIPPKSVNMNKSSDKETPYDMYTRGLTLEESLNIVARQDQEISRLKSELNSVKHERELLIIEVSKLKFELEIADDLKKLYSVK